MKTRLENININRLEHLLSPNELKSTLPTNKTISKTVLKARNIIKDILAGKDKRLLGIVGPCSIHDYNGAIEYAKKIKTIQDAISDTIYLIMRVYFEKPRTTLGWRGLIIDPDMNNTNNIQKGLHLGRKMLLDINELGIPTGSEYLDPIVPNYIDDLICWASIGARTIESQIHRDMASGVSVPVGFKNSTDGNLTNAINAMLLSSTSRAFIGADKDGNTCIVHTKGNHFTHLILRGGHSGPNYSPKYIKQANTIFKKNNLPTRIVIDCSHGNSSKNYKNQSKVLTSIIKQHTLGEKTIKGFMIESNLKEGNQAISSEKGKLIYGKSVTDGCIGFNETKRTLLMQHKKLVAYYNKI